MMRTYCVHTSNEGIISGRLILRGEQKTISLSCSDIDHFRFGLISVDAVDLNDSHVVALKPKVLTCKGANVHNMDQVRLPGLDGYGQVLRVVEQCVLRNRLGASWVHFVEEFWYQHLHPLVIPIRD